jgi:hypothetical protein
VMRRSLAMALSRDFKAAAAAFHRQIGDARKAGWP